MTHFTDMPVQANDNSALDSFFDNIQAPAVSSTDEIMTSQPTNIAEDVDTTLSSDIAASQQDNNAFAELGLSPVLLKSIVATGYTTPTPIQAQAIPAALAGRDLLLSAQTGSGKTAAFVLPILHRLSQNAQDKGRNRQPKAVKALILTPTRELAHQVGDSIRRYGSAMRDLYSVPLVGGAAYSGQIRALKKGVQIIVATPGRLLDHINAGRVDLSALEVLVLDEADRMLDMGFADDIDRILQATPANRQTVMSSATWDGPVGKIAESFTQDPERINIKVETAHIDEKVYFCDNFDHKNKLLESLICEPERQQAIIFTATKRSSEELAERLAGWGHKACYLHGDLPQSKRNRIVADLRSGKYDIVVATDVAARGLDLPNISHVFNYDLPRQVEDYVHRIGRSGRAGRTGIAINLCSRDDRRQFSAINRYLKRDINEAVVIGLEPKFVEKSEGRGRNGNRDGRSGRRDNGSFNQRQARPRNYQVKDDQSSGYDNRAKRERAEEKPTNHHSERRNSSNTGYDKPRRRRDGQDYHQADRAAQGNDRQAYGRDDSNSKDGYKKSGYQKTSYQKNSYQTEDNSPSRYINAAKSSRSGDSYSRDDRKPRQFDKSYQDNAGSRRPRPVVEETFGTSPKRRANSDQTSERRDNVNAKAKRHDYYDATKKSRQDGFNAPKRAPRDSSRDGQKEGFSPRRNSTGKPF